MRITRNPVGHIKEFHIPLKPLKKLSLPYSDFDASHSILTHFVVKNDHAAITKLLDLKNSSASSSLDLIKDSNEQLFNFNEANLYNMTVEYVQPDAEFLFVNLKKMEITVEINNNEDSVVDEQDARMIEMFESKTKQKQIDFIKLTITPIRYYKLIQPVPRLGLLVAVHRKIKSLALRSLDLSTSDKFTEFFSTMNGNRMQWSGLTELTLTNCYIPQLYPAIFDIFTNLSKLNLSYDWIVDFDKDALNKTGGNLLELTQFYFIFAYYFTGLTNETQKSQAELHKPAMNRLEIKSLSVFNFLYKLEELELTISSSLTPLDKLYFRLPKSQKLKLQLRKPERNDLTAFDFLSQLKKLEMDFYVEAVVDFFSLDLTRLSTAEITNDKNEINEINVQIERLDQSPSGLKKLNMDVLSVDKNFNFDKMTCLESLELLVSDVKFLQTEPFKALVNLKKLKLILRFLGSKEQVREISNRCDIFNGLVSLTHLVIRDNSKEFTFKIMSCEILKHLPNLEYLDLYGNSIELTDPGLFKYSNKLKFLRLERNKSADLSQFCLDDLTYLERFSLNFNSLNSIQAFNGKNCGNIVCLNLSNNELTCLPAKAFSNLHNLVNLNLSHNKIAEIEAGGFDGLVNLRSLDLAYNLLESLDLNIFDSVDNMPPVNLLILNIHMWNLKSVTYMASATKTHRMGFFSQCRNTVFIRVHKSLMEDTSLIDELVGNGRVYLETENDL